MMSSPLFIICITVGPILIFVGWVLKEYPPKNINHWYGYRTRSSMASKERWDFAQVYSGLEMAKMGLWMMAVGLLGMFIPIPDWAGTYAGITVLFIVLGIMVYRVESEMKRRYPL